MSKHQALHSNKQNNDDVSKLYILTTPTKLSALTLDDLDNSLDDHNNWKVRAKAFRARKERQFMHEF